MKNKQLLLSITALLIISLSWFFLFPNSANGGKVSTDFNKLFNDPSHLRPYGTSDFIKRNCTARIDKT